MQQKIEKKFLGYSNNYGLIAETTAGVF